MSVNLNPSTYVSDVFSSKPLRGSFKENSDAFGPVAATAIGVAQAAAGVADSTVTIGSQALQGLSDAATYTVRTVGDSVEDAVHLVGDGIGQVQDGAHHLKQMAGEGVDALEHAAESAYDGVADFVEDAAHSIGHAATALYDSVGSGVSTLAGYAAAGGQAISELV